MPGRFDFMSLKNKITEDMKTAMRAKETARLGTVRLLLAAMKQKEVDERVELTDADVLSIIEKMLKQRRESIAQYEKAGAQRPGRRRKGRDRRALGLPAAADDRGRSRRGGRRRDQGIRRGRRRKTWAKSWAC